MLGNTLGCSYVNYSIWAFQDVEQTNHNQYKSENLFIFEKRKRKNLIWLGSIWCTWRTRLDLKDFSSLDGKRFKHMTYVDGRPSHSLKTKHASFNFVVGLKN